MWLEFGSVLLRSIKGANQSVSEDAGAQTVANWAMNIGAGPADESGQALNFLVTNTNAALFAVAPSIAANGTLTYTPATNANGSATVTVQLHDNGGTANGGRESTRLNSIHVRISAADLSPEAEAQT